MISIVSSEASPSPRLREARPLDSPAFGALIAALFAQLGSAPLQPAPAAVEAPTAAEEADALENSADLVESAEALAREFGGLAVAPPVSDAALATTSATAGLPVVPAPAAAPAPPTAPALPAAAAPAQLLPSPQPLAGEVRDDSAAALGREPATASEVAKAASEQANSASTRPTPSERTPSESAPAEVEAIGAQPAASAATIESKPELASEREARSETQSHARASQGSSRDLGRASVALLPRRVPELGVEPLPRETTATSEAAPRVESAPAPAAFATERPAPQQSVAPNSGPILERIAWLAEQGGGSARLHLDPPELGELEIVVRVRGRRVDVHLRAEEAGAQQAVLESRERLVEALAAKDFRVDEFSVGGGSRERSEHGSGEPTRERAAASPENSRENTPTRAPNSSRTAELRQAPAGSIDLRV